MKDKANTSDENTKDVETSSKSNAHTDPNDKLIANEKHSKMISVSHINTNGQAGTTDRRGDGEALDTNGRKSTVARKRSTSIKSTREPVHHTPSTEEVRQRKIGTVEMVPHHLEIKETQPRKISSNEMRQHKISTHTLSTDQKQKERKISQDDMRQRKISRQETRAHKLSSGERQQRKISSDEMRHRKISLGDRQQRKMSSEEMRQRSRAGTLSRRDYHAGSGSASVGTTERQYTHPFIHLENTYCLEPEERFPESQVRSLITQMLGDFLKNKQEYSASGMKSASLQLSEMIKSRVLEMKCRRFKIVVLVNIGQRKEHAVQIVSRCLWDTQWDKHVSVSLKTPQWYAEATVFAVYYE